MPASQRAWIETQTVPPIYWSEVRQKRQSCCMTVAKHQTYLSDHCRHFFSLFEYARRKNDRPERKLFPSEATLDACSATISSSESGSELSSVFDAVHANSQASANVSLTITSNAHQKSINPHELYVCHWTCTDGSSSTLHCQSCRSNKYSTLDKPAAGFVSVLSCVDELFRRSNHSQDSSSNRDDDSSHSWATVTIWRAMPSHSTLVVSTLDTLPSINRLDVQTSVISHTESSTGLFWHAYQQRSRRRHF